MWLVRYTGTNNAGYQVSNVRPKSHPLNKNRFKFDKLNYVSQALLQIYAIYNQKLIIQISAVITGCTY